MGLRVKYPTAVRFATSDWSTVDHWIFSDLVTDRHHFDLIHRSVARIIHQTSHGISAMFIVAPLPMLQLQTILQTPGNFSVRGTNQPNQSRRLFRASIFPSQTPFDDVRKLAVTVNKSAHTFQSSSTELEPSIPPESSCLCVGLAGPFSESGDCFSQYDP